ncbi:JmjC domain [Sesbania bispinosa]|nr:JmjC domain [Sesbania bispinosa]
MEKNQPVVLTGLMDHHWRACNDWVTPHGQPNLQFFSTHFGASKVQVADCDTRDFTDQKREEMMVSDFIGCCLQQVKGSAVQCNNENHTSNGHSVSVPYLKDWHFVKILTLTSKMRKYVALTIDLLHGSERCEDLGLLFMLMFSGPIAVSDSKYPGFKRAIWLECTQEAGEIIFVPSGWYHQVHNLEDTISINHNWFNAYNLSWVWNLLLKDYNEAKEYIEDIKDICDDFEGLCQRNLAANTGMNFLTSLLSCHTSPWPTWKIASDMKHMHALEGNQDCAVDIIKAFKDPRFSQLCMHVGRTYLTIHEQSNLFSDFESSSTVNLVDLNVLKAYTSSQVYTPEDLINFIDNAVTELGDCYIESSVLHVA